MKCDYMCMKIPKIGNGVYTHHSVQRRKIGKGSLDFKSGNGHCAVAGRVANNPPPRAPQLRIMGRKGTQRQAPAGRCPV